MAHQPDPSRAPRRNRTDTSRTPTRSREPSKAPALPEEITFRDLDREAWRGLRSLPKDLAEAVACRLVMVERLIVEDPALAYAHAAEARRMARRVGVVREACGFAAYRAEFWAEALAELRAARRMTGSDAYLAVIADCERGMGRPERALAVIRSTQGGTLDGSTWVELCIVESGARRDLGQFDAAVQVLQGLRPWADAPHAARLFYAYSEALRHAGRTDEAVEWLARAAAADESGETDAGERLAEFDAIEIIDTAEEA